MTDEKSLRRRAFEHAHSLRHHTGRTEGLFSLLEMEDLSLSSQQEEYFSSLGKAIRSEKKVVGASLERFDAQSVQSLDDLIEPEQQLPYVERTKQAFSLLKDSLKQEEAPLSDQQQEYVTLLGQAIESEMEFVYASMESFDKRRYTTSLVDLVQPAQQLVTQYKPSLTSQQQLEFEAPNELFAQTNKHVYTQALDNLLSNAQKYTPSGSIDVYLFEEGEEAVVQVKDEGSGIPADALEEIFTYGNAVRKRQGDVKGHGIGLSQLKREVEAVGGRVTVDSEEGVGSTFALYFPSA